VEPGHVSGRPDHAHRVAPGPKICHVTGAVTVLNVTRAGGSRWRTTPARGNCNASRGRLCCTPDGPTLGYGLSPEGGCAPSGRSGTGPVFFFKTNLPAIAPSVLPPRIVRHQGGQCRGGSRACLDRQPGPPRIPASRYSSPRRSMSHRSAKASRAWIDSSAASGTSSSSFSGPR
jgi:hypothetical protein